jgi:predicted RNase H-like nuclease (RuvC/YqgF family)
MSDTKESMPAQPKTTIQLEAPPAWAIEMSQRMADGFARQETRADTQDDRLDKIERQVKIAVEDGKENNKRITTLEVRFDEADRRADQSSVRAKSVTENDSKQDAAIATLVTDVASLKTEVGELKKTLGEVKSLVTGFFEDPRVRFVGKLIFVLATGYAAARGIKVLP